MDMMYHGDMTDEVFFPWWTIYCADESKNFTQFGCWIIELRI